MKPRYIPTLPGRVAAVRLQTTGTQLGALPLVAAAIPSIKDLARRAINSVIGIVDPGKKRDANRQARAAMWCDFANAGSITAARRVLGGSQVQYTAKERQYYIDCWNKLKASEPMLAQQAQALGPLGVPEPGSDVAPPFLADEEISSLQREVDAYRSGASALPASSPKLLTVQAGFGGNAGVLLALGIAGAFLARRR